MKFLKPLFVIIIFSFILVSCSESELVTSQDNQLLEKVKATGEEADDYIEPDE